MQSLENIKRAPDPSRGGPTPRRAIQSALFGEATTSQLYAPTLSALDWPPAASVPEAKPFEKQRAWRTLL